MPLSRKDEKKERRVHYRVPLEDADIRVARKFFEVMRNHVGCRAAVETKQGQSMDGVFVAFEPMHLSIILWKDGNYTMIRGDSVAQIRFKQPRYERLETLRSLVSKMMQVGDDVSEIYLGIGKVVVKFRDDSRIFIYKSGDVCAIGGIASKYLDLLREKFGR